MDSSLELPVDDIELDVEAVEDVSVELVSEDVVTTVEVVVIDTEELDRVLEVDTETLEVLVNQPHARRTYIIVFLSEL